MDTPVAAKPDLLGLPFARLAPLALGLIALATFARGLWFGFAFDDVSVICNSTRIRELSSVYEVFVRPSQWIIGDHANSLLITYRPLALGSMVLDYAVAAGAPWVFHATNVALHVCCVLLLWRFLADVGLRASTCFGLALLFAVHPVGAEAITWINGRSEPLCLLFGLLTLSLCARGGELTWRRCLAIAAALCASLLGKETGFAFCVLGVALLARRGERRALVAGGGALAVGLVSYLALRVNALAGVQHEIALSPSTLAIVAPIWWRALQAALLPVDLGLENLMAWMRTASALELVASQLVAVALVCATIIGWLRGRTLTSIGLAWWLGTLAAPSITLATGIYWPGLSRWVYVAVPGLLLALGPAIERHATLRSTYALSGLLALAFAFEAQRSIAVWQSDATLLRHMTARYPGDALAGFMPSVAQNAAAACPPHSR